MQTEIRRAEDKTILVCVRFRLEAPYDDGPEVEAIFSAHWPNDVTLATTVIGLVLLSTTRTDTRETVPLDNATMGRVVEVASLAADDYERSLLP
jgi:hypothetical protein